MKELVLHIGYGKTGSSALQSWFAINAKALVKQGVMYAGLNEDAKNFQVSSGNGAMMRSFLFEDSVSEEQLLEYYFGECDKAIVSNEQLQPLRSDSAEADKLARLMEKYDIRVHFVAYIRNIYNHFYSNYVQAVKRSGSLLSFEDWVSTRLEIKPFESYESLSKKWPITLISYDLSIDNLAFSFCRSVKLDYSRLKPMSKAKVNRTLSYSEISLIQRLSRIGLDYNCDPQVTSRLLSDDLVNIYPNKTTNVFLNSFIQQEIINRYSQHIANFNIECERNFGFTVEVLNETGYVDEQTKDASDSLFEVSSSLSKIIISNKLFFKTEVIRAFSRELMKHNSWAAIKALVFAGLISSRS